MPMTQFEKAVVSELKNIRKELHELNKKKSEKPRKDIRELDERR